MAVFNPPDSHWADDFDSRLRNSFFYLKERLDADTSEFLSLVVEMRTLRDEMRQLAADCKWLLDETRKER